MKVSVTFISALMIGSFILNSACVGMEKETKPRLDDNQSVSSSRNWILIDPVEDFKTDATFNITGPTELNVTGTTDFPAGTSLEIRIIQTFRTRYVVTTTVKVRANRSGQNSFSYNYDMKGNPPDRYRVLAYEPEHVISGHTDFNISSETSYYKWIRMDPVNLTGRDRLITVSGTTDLPAGSEIVVSTNVVIHSCTMATPDSFGIRSLCGGRCFNTGTICSTQVVTGTGGLNRWNASVDISPWCDTEEYAIVATAGGNWTNVTAGGQDGYRIPKA